MADILADVTIGAELTEAQILAGGIQSGQSWPASDTGRRFTMPVAGGTPRPDTPLSSDIVNNSSVAGTTQSDVNVTLKNYTDSEVATATGLIDSRREIVHGFVDPDGIVFTYINATRVLTYSHPSGFVQFWSGGTYYSFANGSAELTTISDNLNQTCWLYFDTGGNLACKTSLVWDDVKTTCLGHLVKYDVDLFGVGNGGYTLTISRMEDCQANHVENYASYRSKGVQAVKGAGIGFTGVVGDTQTGYNAAAYFSARDYEFSVPSVNFDAVSWLRYHYDGADDAGQYRIILSVSPAPTGTPIIIGTDIGLAGNNAVYNVYDSLTDSFTVAECPANDFVIGHLAVADGGSQKVISLAPQGKYSTLNDAVEAMETEVEKLTGDDSIFRDVAVSTSFIVKGNLSGGFLPVDAAGNAFYYHSISAQGGGGTGANNQGLEDVIAIDPVATSVPTFTNGLTTGETASATLARGDGAVVSVDAMGMVLEETETDLKAGVFLQTGTRRSIVSSSMTNTPPQVSPSEATRYEVVTRLSEDTTFKYVTIQATLIPSNLSAPEEPRRFICSAVVTDIATAPWAEIATNATAPMTWTQLGTSGVYYGKRGGVVHMRGSFSQSGSPVAGTLPNGYRPINTIYYEKPDASFSVLQQIQVATDGTVAVTGSTTACSFDAFSFPAEQ